MKKGYFCISLDTELLWGRKQSDWDKFSERAKVTKKIIIQLLQLFEKYQIPATWAVVGKLYEEEPKLVAAIRQTANQEIASHSYSHKIFTKIDKKQAENEVKKNKAFSFVFPQNEIKYLKLLKKHGFGVYRGLDKNEKELLLPRTPPVYKPVIRSGLVNIPGSLYFVSGRGVRKYIPKGIRLLKSVIAIKKAAKQKKIFHLWFHPIDLADDSQKLIWELEQIISYADRMRRRQLLEIKTMKELSLQFRRKRL